VNKRSLKRADFSVDANISRRGLIDSSYIELPIPGHHVLAVSGLPDIHRDPFDRIQIAQAKLYIFGGHRKWGDHRTSGFLGAMHQLDNIEQCIMAADRLTLIMSRCFSVPKVISLAERSMSTR